MNDALPGRSGRCNSSSHRRARRVHSSSFSLQDEMLPQPPCMLCSIIPNAKLHAHTIGRGSGWHNIAKVEWVCRPLDKYFYTKLEMDTETHHRQRPSTDFDICGCQARFKQLHTPTIPFDSNDLSWSGRGTTPVVKTISIPQNRAIPREVLFENVELHLQRRFVLASLD